MQQVTLTIGHNVHGVPTLETGHVLKAAANILDMQGLTAIPCYGVWQGEIESSTRLEIAGLTEDEAAAIMARIPALCAELKQDAIMAELTESAAQFITAAQAEEMRA